MDLWIRVPNVLILLREPKQHKGFSNIPLEYNEHLEPQGVENEKEELIMKDRKNHKNKLREIGTKKKIKGHSPDVIVLNDHFSRL
jgi:hypothetical protein